jgi:signal transduction histidine kinase
MERRIAHLFNPRLAGGLPHSAFREIRPMQAVPIQLERATAAGGVTGALVRRLDWSRTPLGPIAAWPASLQAAASTCLTTGFPMAVNWGRELIQIYNDAAIPVFANKHPDAMGRPARINFPEFWELSTIEAIVQNIFKTALPFRAEDERVMVRRYGLLEEAYFTFSFSPILDDDGTVLGILNTYVETTSRVLGERRMATLRALAEREVRARTATEACAEALVALSDNPYDLRFVLLYLVAGDGSSGTLTGATGIVAGGPAAPRAIAAAGVSTEAFTWPLEEVLRSRQPVLVEDLPSRVDLGPRPGRTSHPRDALVLPLVRSRDAAPAGIVVVGLSPRLRLEDTYRGFLQLVAAQIAAGIGSAEAYEEASERARRLAEIDRAKNVFYTNISHEFRTPLTLLLAPVEDLLHDQEVPLTHAQRERLLALRRNALRLRRLVSGLLDLARIEAGSLELQSEETDLADLTREIASAFEPSMTAAGLRLVVDCPPLPRAVRIDTNAWETIVPNLLSNALKYTSQGSVTLRLRAIGDRIRLVVQDTGIGIPRDVLPHVFERFYRSRESQARSIEGTGIGLALVRELVRALGGDVSVESAHGEGSTFTVEIPFERAPTPGPSSERSTASAAGRAAFVQEAETWVERREPAHAKAAEVPGATVRARTRVLVAEDNADMRQYLADVLSRDHEVMAVADGVEALHAIPAFHPDLVLSDVVMPGLDGLALVRALREEPATRSIPAILITARAGEDAALEGLGSGADDYIVKPFSSRELLARVRTHVDLARARREAAESAMKDTFIGVVSHELRTPLTSIKLQTQLLARQAARGGGRPNGGGRLDVIRRGVARMESLVDDLLSLSAIQSGALALHREQSDLGAICKLAAEEQTLITQRRVSLDLPAEPISAPVDPHRIQQVVSNLLSNALKYSPPDRPVTLRLRRNDGEAIASVRDEGPGIPAAALPRLFEQFYRVPGVQVTAGSRTGLGLGLYISRAIVVRHGGSIEVDTQPGQGTTFSVHLPLAAASQEPGA